MAQNKVQDQRGLSMPEFYDRYRSPQQCEDLVRVWRWPKGFVCPRCQVKSIQSMPLRLVLAAEQAAANLAAPSRERTAAVDLIGARGAAQLATKAVTTLLRSGLRVGYEVNHLSNGGFEVVWPQRGFIEAPGTC
jgi:hypothetical protein